MKSNPEGIIFQGFTLFKLKNHKKIKIPGTYRFHVV